MSKHKYSLINEDDAHYELQHDDGSRFKVAKSALSKQVQENVKQYFGGGVVEGEAYADGGEVESDEGDVGDVEAAPTQDAVPVAGQPAPQQAAPTEGPKPGSVLAESLPEYAQAFQAQKGAAAEQAAAEGNLGQELAGVYNQGAKGLAELQQDDQARQLKIQQDSDTFKQDLAKGNINPNNLYEKMSTPQRILTGIGLVLGGIGGVGTGGRNMVADMLDREAQQDIEAQKANVSNKQSLYRLNLDQSGSEREASLLTQRQMLDHMQVEAQKKAALAADPKAQAGVSAFSAALDMKKAEIDNSLRLFNWQKQLSTQPFKKEALGLATPEQQKRAVILPDGQTAVLATDEKAATDARGAINTVKPVLDTLSQIEQIRSSVIPIGEKAEQVRSLIPTAMLQLKQAQKLGRLSPETVDMLQKQFSNPTELVDAVRGPAKTKTLKNSLTNQLYTQLQSASPAFNNPNQVPVKPAVYGR